jgi:serpin B
LAIASFRWVHNNAVHGVSRAYQLENARAHYDPFVELCRFRLCLAGSGPPADFDSAVSATNQLGLQLYRECGAPQENLCLSPYSIQSALAMTFAGADGATRAEMSRFLHYSGEGDAIHASFSDLQKALEESVKKSNESVQQARKLGGGPGEPITIVIANRLFPQSGYAFRDAFRALIAKFYGGGFEPLDFRKDPDAAREHINKWVAEQTRDRIRDLIPRNGVDGTTRLVLANALYLKAPWQSDFSDFWTKPAPFHARGGSATDVPTMHQRHHLGYATKPGFTVVALPYVGSELQFLIILPNETSGLGTIASAISSDMLMQCARLQDQLVDLYLPKFKFEPPTIPLAGKLRALGLQSVFDQPSGSANFDRMAPRKPDDYLAVSEIFHKTFIAVDEKGTEAAAATAVAMLAGSAVVKQPEPIVVKVDHPFLYAIQHIPSGVCLFIGRVTDPR